MHLKRYHPAFPDVPETGERGWVEICLRFSGEFGVSATYKLRLDYDESESSMNAVRGTQDEAIMECLRFAIEHSGSTIIASLMNLGQAMMLARDQIASMHFGTEPMPNWSMQWLDRCAQDFLTSLRKNEPGFSEDPQ